MSDYRQPHLWNQTQPANHDLRGSQPKEKGGAPEDARQGVDMLNIAEERNVSKQHRANSAAIPVTGSRISLNGRTTSIITTITPEKASKLRSDAHFPRQRLIKSGNIDRLVVEMKAGRFIVGIQIYICVLPDGTEYVVNGNHTLEAIIKGGFSQSLTVTHHPVKDIEEAAAIYSVFDLQSRRSAGDSIRAYGFTIPNSKSIYAAMPIIRTDFVIGHTGIQSRPDLLEMMSGYEEEAVLFDNSTKRNTDGSALTKRAGIVAVALETFRYCPDDASVFWSNVCALDEDLRPGMPERALLRWMRGNKTSGKLGQLENSRAAACAWNASVQGKEVSYVKPSMMKTFYLLGTPRALGAGEGDGGIRGIAQ